MIGELLHRLVKFVLVGDSSGAVLLAQWRSSRSGTASRNAHLEKFSLNFQVRRLSFASIVTTLNHPRSFMV